MKALPIAGAVLVLAIHGAAAPAQNVTLRYQWKQGDVLLYRTTIRTTGTLTGGPAGSAGPVEQTIAQTVKFVVAAVGADGGATLRQTIETVSMKVDGPMGKLAYDSAAPPGEDADPRVLGMAKTFGAMVGQPISVTIASTGSVRRIDGTARIVEKLLEGLPRDPMAAGLAQNIRSMLSDAALRSSLEQSFSKMPEQAVKLGDAWTSEQPVGPEASGRLIGTSTFTLKELEGTGGAAVARIAITLALKQDVTPANGASMAIKLDQGGGQGEVLFDVAAGRVSRNTMHTDIRSTATRRGPDGTASTLQNHTTTSMTMELVGR